MFAHCLIAVSLLAAPCAALAQAASPAPAKAGANAGKAARPALKSAYREINWDELVPKD